MEPWEWASHGFPIPRGQMTVYQKLISLKLFLTSGHILSIYSATRSLPTPPLVDATLTSNQHEPTSATVEAAFHTISVILLVLN